MNAFETDPSQRALENFYIEAFVEVVERAAVQFFTLPPRAIAELDDIERKLIEISNVQEHCEKSKEQEVRDRLLGRIAAIKALTFNHPAPAEPLS